MRWTIPARTQLTMLGSPRSNGLGTSVHLCTVVVRSAIAVRAGPGVVRPPFDVRMRGTARALAEGAAVEARPQWHGYTSVVGLGRRYSCGCPCPFGGRDNARALMGPTMPTAAPSPGEMSWRRQDSNLRLPGHEPGTLPLRHSAKNDESPHNGGLRADFFQVRFSYINYLLSTTVPVIPKVNPVTSRCPIVKAESEVPN